MKRKTNFNLPNSLTVLRMILAVVFLILLLIPDRWAHVFAFLVFVIAAITDKLDGYLARKNKEETKLGAVMDPIADKMLINLAFLALVMLDIVPVWVFAIILVRDFAIDGLRITVAGDNKDISASYLGKLKTASQMIALVILLLTVFINFQPLVIIGNIFLYIALIMTVLSAIEYFYDSRKLLNK